jgi:hypothetical protein
VRQSLNVSLYQEKVGAQIVSYVKFFYLKKKKRASVRGEGERRGGMGGED